MTIQYIFVQSAEKGEKGGGKGTGKGDRFIFFRERGQIYFFSTMRK